eukprot:SAG31_NODE_904_length_11120_cov_76.575084_10_plen_436_part_00
MFCIKRVLRVVQEYPTAGFVAIPLPATGSEPAAVAVDITSANALLDQLAADKWIDRYTRAMLLDFALADTQQQLLTAVKILIEFNPSGRVIGSYSIRTVQQVPLFDSGSTQAWLELLLMVMTAVYLLDEVRDFVQYICLRAKLSQSESPSDKERLQEADYFADPWNVIDVISYVLFGIAFYWEIWARVELSSAADQLNTIFAPHMAPAYSGSSNSSTAVGDCGQYTEALCNQNGCVLDRNSNCVPPGLIAPEVFFGTAVVLYGPAWAASFACTLLGLNSVVVWLKMLKYLNMFPHLAMMSTTIANAMAPSLAFFIMFFIFFMGYAQGFVMVFGAAIEGYSSVTSSMLSLFRALLGDFDVTEMTKVDKVVGPLLFLIFVIVGMLFLLNVFIAILSESYEKAKIHVFGDAFDERDKVRPCSFGLLLCYDKPFELCPG